MNSDPRKINQHLASPDISARVVERSRMSDHLRNPRARIPLLLREECFASNHSLNAAGAPAAQPSQHRMPGKR